MKASFLLLLLCLLLIPNGCKPSGEPVQPSASVTPSPQTPQPTPTSDPNKTYGELEIGGAGITYDEVNKALGEAGIVINPTLSKSVLRIQGFRGNLLIEQGLWDEDRTFKPTSKKEGTKSELVKLLKEL